MGRTSTLLAVVACLVLAGASWALASRPALKLQATPAKRTVSAGKSVEYSIRIRRLHQWKGPVRLQVSNLPRGVKAVWQLPLPKRAGRAQRYRRYPRRALALAASVRGATIVFKTSKHTPRRTFRPLVSARGHHAFAKLRVRLRVVAAAAKPVVVTPTPTPASVPPQAPLALAGYVAGSLRPGASVPVDVAVTNPLSSPVKLTRLDVTVVDTTSQPGCSGLQNYIVDQLAAPLPLTAPPGTTYLSALVGGAALPHVRMLDLLQNQDNCKGAQVQIDLSAAASE
jgi:hypothetical protein